MQKLRDINYSGKESKKSIDYSYIYGIIWLSFSMVISPFVLYFFPFFFNEALKPGCVWITFDF
jgi:hypothetical protein